MTKAVHIPRRTCIVCRQQANQVSLLRFTKGQTSVLISDDGVRCEGRGYYVHNTPACLDRFTLSGRSRLGAKKTKKNSRSSIAPLESRIGIEVANTSDTAKNQNRSQCQEDAQNNSVRRLV